MTNEDEEKRNEIALELSNKFNININNLDKIPSITNTKLSVLANAIYKKSKENNNSINKMFSYNNLINDNNTTNLDLLSTEFDNIMNIADSSEGMTNGIFDYLKLENYVINKIKEDKSKEESNNGIIAPTPIDNSCIEPIPPSGDEVPPIPKGTPINSEVEGIAPVLNFDIEIEGSVGNYPIDTGFSNAFKKLYNDKSTYTEEYVLRKIIISASQPEAFSVKKITIGDLPNGVSIVDATINADGSSSIGKAIFNEEGSLKYNGFNQNTKTGELELYVKYYTWLDYSLTLDIELESTHDIKEEESNNKNCKSKKDSKVIIDVLSAKMNYGLSIRPINVNNPYSLKFSEFCGENGYCYENGFVLSTNKVAKP